MDLRILGPIELVVGEDAVELPAKLRSLLAVLVLRLGQVVSADMLAESLWPQDVPERWETALHGYVSKLRKILGSEAITTRAPGYVLALGPETIDAGRFEVVVARARAAQGHGHADEAAELLEQALALWRGAALGGFADHPFGQAEAARLEELRLTATEEFFDLKLAQGRHVEVVGPLRTLLEDHPLRERLWSQLVLALYRSGRGSEALRSFTALRQHLGEELGIEPGPELRRLEQDVLSQRPELEWHPPPTPRAREIPTNLPLARSSFVGRHDELAELSRALAAPGLVTMVGPGGVGKTRLATEAARAVSSQYPDGVWLVELATLSDPSLVAQAVAVALGAREEPGHALLETMAKALAATRTLIVLDNCEHVVDAAAAVADALIGTTGHLSILATSREPLRVQGEVVWLTPSLPVPDGDHLPPEEIVGIDAVRLFCERAGAQGPFTLGPDNAAAVAALCRGLDGIPLAIELAAARSAALSPAQILERLDRRFHVLRTGRRTVPRHETLAAAVEWSHDLLGADERTLFRRLSVFRGFPLEGAEEVCSDGCFPRSGVAAVMGDLVDRSLVVAQRHEDGLRYSLLETLRAYAAERLDESGEEDEVRRRHLGWITALAQGYDERQWSNVPAPDAGEWESRCRIEHDNVRAAFTWALGHDPDAALRLVRDLALQWKGSGYVGEARRWAAAALAAGDAAPPALRAWALRRAGTLAGDQGDYTAGRPLHEEAAAIFRAIGDKEALAGTLAGGMAPSLRERDPVAARSMYEEALSLAQEVQAHKWEAWAKGGLAMIASDQGDFERAEHLMNDALAVFKEIGTGVHQWQLNLGNLALRQGDLGRARVLLEEALLEQRQRNARGLLPSTIGALAEIAILSGDIDASLAGFDEVVELGRDTSRTGIVAYGLRGMARAAVRQGDLRRARSSMTEALRHGREPTSGRLLDEIETLTAIAVAEARWDRAAELLAVEDQIREAFGTPVPPVQQPQRERDLAAVRNGLDPAAMADAWARGRSMSHEGVVRRALADWGIDHPPAATVDPASGLDIRGHSSA